MSTLLRARRGEHLVDERGELAPRSAPSARARRTGRAATTRPESVAVGQREHAVAVVREQRRHRLPVVGHVRRTGRARARPGGGAPRSAGTTSRSIPAAACPAAARRPTTLAENVYGTGYCRPVAAALGAASRPAARSAEAAPNPITLIARCIANAFRRQTVDRPMSHYPGEPAIMRHFLDVPLLEGTQRHEKPRFPLPRRA